MTVGDSPAVARHRVRVALRAARRRRKLTQGQVAQALEWSLSKVQRIESGEVSVSATDLRSLLAYLGITDDDIVKRLVDDARVSRRERWLTDAKIREHLTPNTRQMLQFESRATAIRAFNPAAVPGLLQTDQYARAMLKSRTDVLPEDTQEVRHDIRMRRRGHVFSRDDPPAYMAILDESVLWRELGGPRVTADQFLDLLMIMRQPKIRIRVVPFSEAAGFVLLGPFTVFEFGDDPMSVLYTEGYDNDSIIQKPQEVRKHENIFNDLWTRSLDEAASERLILARTATILSSLDRPAFHA